MQRMKLSILPIFESNYVYLFYDEDEDWCAVVDPGEAEAPLKEAKRLGRRISHILVTHHHYDHVDGIADIVKASNATVIGFDKDAARIPLIDKQVGDGTSFNVGRFTFEVHHTPGHTLGHIIYVEKKERICFAGDTLFVMGCGRLFEGSAAQMQASFDLLKALPPDMEFCCAHEYGLSNGRFALSLEPDNKDIKARMREIESRLAQKQPYMPAKLVDELRTNPFMRTNDDKLKHNIHAMGKNSQETFALLRHRKDNF